jgi:hypothetical protein
MRSDKEYPKHMWWHSHPLFVLPKGKLPEPRKGKEDEYNQFREHYERAAWTYELVRRLRLVLNLPKLKGCKPPPAFIVEVMETLPVFVELPLVWVTAIAASLNFHFGFRPVSVSPSLLPKGAKGYAELPRMAFDLTASYGSLAEHFLSIVDSLRAEHGIPRERRTSHMSKNKGKTKRGASWHHLDYICDPINVACPDCKPARLASNLAQTALSNVDAVALGVLIAIEEEQVLPAVAGRPVWCRPGISIPKVPVKIKPVMSSHSTTRYPSAEHLAKIFGRLS